MAGQRVPTRESARSEIPDGSGAARPPVLLLSEDDLACALTPQACVDALLAAYRDLAAAPEDGGQALGFRAAEGTIHVKASLAPRRRDRFLAKINANMPGNPARNGLPTIQGVAALIDARDGRPLAILDSGALTAHRTAATAALAARLLARGDIRRLALIGCGTQAAQVLACFRAVFALERVRAFDIDAGRAAAFARAAAAGGIAVTVSDGVAADGVAAAAREADACVLCTTSSESILFPGMVGTGCFVAAIGADNPAKAEVAPALLAAADIVVDDRESCLAAGDMRAAIAAGMLAPSGVRATLAEVAAGTAAPRRCDGPTIFKSTGSAVQDVAVASAAYDIALARGLGTPARLAGAGAAADRA